jgi:hypothetical protein
MEINELKDKSDLNFESIWMLFQETDRKFKETDKKFQETSKRIQETTKQMQETDKKFQDTDKKFKETSKKLNQLERLFTSQWGKLMETLVEGDLIAMLNNRGVKVNVTFSRVGGIYEGKQFEIDIIAENGDEIVVVEVKTTLKPDDVKDFQKQMNNIRKYLPRYKESKIYGAVAYLTADGNAHIMAENKGFFIIRATGKSATITNSEDFKPKEW